MQGRPGRASGRAAPGVSHPADHGGRLDPNQSFLPTSKAKNKQRDWLTGIMPMAPHTWAEVSPTRVQRGWPGAPPGGRAAPRALEQRQLLHSALLLRSWCWGQEAPPVRGVSLASLAPPGVWGPFRRSVGILSTICCCPWRRYPCPLKAHGLGVLLLKIKISQVDGNQTRSCLRNTAALPCLGVTWPLWLSPPLTLPVHDT